MQERYSTAQQQEMRSAVGKVIEIATARQIRATPREEAPVIAPLNTALDSWPAIRLIGAAAGTSFDPRGV